MEINNDYFTVQRSKDGQNWEDVSEIDGHGTVNQEANYSIIDTRPLAGVSYYRLIQTDFDGTKTFSNIVAVEREINAIEIFPNPASNSVTVLAESFEDFQLVNAIGQSVFDQTMIINEGKNVRQIDLSSLPNGFYLLYVEGKAHSLIVE